MLVRCCFIRGRNQYNNILFQISSMIKNIYIYFYVYKIPKINVSTLTSINNGILSVNIKIVITLYSIIANV